MAERAIYKPSDKHVKMPSWVAPTYDPSGGTKVLERLLGLLGWAVVCNMLACPLQVES
ncbi:hypothetical protein SESBI_17007 [Sesbania bispinosa]|nr:hypothetical protein SESBI_17007 [Sesbania bispinosa]